MPKKIIIIGEGAAVYARLKGYDADILKMHNISGGLVTAWKRKAPNQGGTYAFEGCIHYMVGVAKKSHFREIMRELWA